MSLIQKIHEEHVAHYSGQDNFVITAYGQNYMYLGRIDYSIFQNELYIDMIEVEPQFRRLGVASELMNVLKRKGMKIHYGYSTPDGTQFLNAFVRR